MSIDKFGRHEYSLKIKGAKGPPGEGFKLTSEGNYDIDNKQLKNVGDPKEDGDVVNLKTFKEQTLIKEEMEIINSRSKKPEKINIWNAGGARIRNVDDPIEGSHVVTKQYLEANTPKESDNYWSFGNKRLVKVSDPHDNTDVVTKGWFSENSIAKRKYNYSIAKRKKIKDKEDVWDCGEKRLIYLDDAVNATDAINKQTLTRELQSVTSKFPKLSEDNKGYDFGGKRVGNIGDPVNDNDATNLKTLKVYMSMDKKTKEPPITWDAQKLQIRYVGDPTTDTDAINKKTLTRELNDKLKNVLFAKEDGTIDVKNKVVKNLATPIRITDAVNVEYLMLLLGEIMYDIYYEMSTVMNDRHPIRSTFKDTSKASWIDRWSKEEYFKPTEHKTINFNIGKDNRLHSWQKQQF